MNRLRQLRIKNGDTQKELAKFLGVTPQMVYKYEKGISDIPDSAEKKISERYGVSIDFLKKNEGVLRSTRIPVYASIPAGIPLASITEIVGWEDIPSDLPGEYFALQVKGHSMEPIIRDRDIVICTAQSSVENGDIAVVVVETDEATLKQYKRTDEGILLIGFNAAVYPPHFYTAHEVNTLPIRIVGRAIEVRHKL